MPELLTLSRAARLVGAKRGTLQRMIKSGELATFEGMVSVQDLQRACPGVSLDDEAVLERFAKIKDEAFAQRVRERVLPSSEVLFARLIESSKRLARAQAGLDYHRRIVEHLRQELLKLGDSAASPAAIGGLVAWLGRALRSESDADESQPLLAQDSFMRIMTAQVRVQPSGHEFFVEGNDTVLEAALRAGLSVSYGCSNGNCGKCKATVLQGEIQRTRHCDYVLSEAEKNARVMLMCCNTAVVDLVIEAHEAQGARDLALQSIAARVKSVSAPGEDVRLVHLQTPRSNRLRFLAGQSVSLTLADGTSALLPVASCPCDDRNLEFHVPRRPGDAFSESVFNRLCGMDTVRIDGPSGDFVLDEESSRSLIFVACGSGFAPIKGLIENAMALDFAATIHLYWSASGETGHYLSNLCRSWADALDNFHYVPVTAGTRRSYEEQMDEALARVMEDHQDLCEYDIYVAGPAPPSGEAQRSLLERGLPASQWFVSPATPC